MKPPKDTEISVIIRRMEIERVVERGGGGVVVVFVCTCRYQNAQIINTGTGQRSTGTGTSSGAGSPILDNSLVSSCLT
jgi:hypothetical protein